MNHFRLLQLSLLLDSGNLQFIDSEEVFFPHKISNSPGRFEMFSNFRGRKDPFDGDDKQGFTVEQLWKMENDVQTLQLEKISRRFNSFSVCFSCQTKRSCAFSICHWSLFFVVCYLLLILREYFISSLNEMQKSLNISEWLLQDFPFQKYQELWKTVD